MKAPVLLTSLWLGALVDEAHAINCDSIHAVRIADAEELDNCNLDEIGNSPGPLALGCAGMTANECAIEHYDNPGSYVDPTGTGAFDLYYLPSNNTLKCADGTKPHFYYSPGNNNASSDHLKWIIYHNGGSGKCGRRKDRLDNYTEAGLGCFEQFDTGDGANSGYYRKDQWVGEGILDKDTSNTDFRTWNRVWIPSCSNDQYQGSEDHPRELVFDDNGTQWNAFLYSQGHEIVLSVIDELASGNLSRDLTDATLVVLYGSSGGAGGLQMTLDAKADKVDAVSNARVVGLLDSRAEPNIAGSEGMFDGTSDCESVYDDDPDCSDFEVPIAGEEDAGFEFDGTAYQPPASCTGCGTARLAVEWWGDNLDASCVAHHGANNTACYEGYHVMYHHTRTPIFLATSLRDSNQYNNPIEYVSVAEGDDVTFQSLETASCGSLPRERVKAQLQSYQADRDTANGAHGESRNAGPIGIWAIDWAKHEITKKNCTFLHAELDSTSLSDAFYDWAVNENDVFLLDAPGFATRTTNPNCAEEVLTCPYP